MTYYGTFESVMNTSVYQQNKVKKQVMYRKLDILKIYSVIRFQLLCVSKIYRVCDVSWQLNLFKV